MPLNASPPISAPSAAISVPTSPSSSMANTSTHAIRSSNSRSSALLEAKQRRRGALSCAECRRLKLRCDRQFPCHSCRKRGCAAICPDGALTTGKGNRFILANTEQLHERIEELQERIASLESTLSTLYTSTRSALDPFPHPLLTDELLNIKTPIGAEIVGSLNPRLRQRSAAPAPGGNSGLRELNGLGNQQQHVSGAVGGGGGEGQESDGEHAGELTESFGTLALGEGSEGKSTFFGNAAGALFLLGEQDAEEEDKKPSPSDLLSTSLEFDPDQDPLSIPSSDHLPTSGTGACAASASASTASASGAATGGLAEPLDRLAKTFPFSIHGNQWSAIKDKLREQLPDPHHAWTLSEYYFNYGGWLYRPVPRTHFIEKIFTPILDPSHNDPQNPTDLQPAPADYSLLFIILALGSILDITQPPHTNPSTAGEFYHILSRVALGAIEPLPDSLAGVQTLLLMCYYNQFSYSKKAPMRVWMLSGIACKMATAMGLHRDGKRWNLGEEECQIRRTVYWELMMFDTWSSQALGRPPTMWSAHCDVQMPDDVPEYNDIHGNPEMSFHCHKYHAASMMVEILNEAFAAKRPTYDTILRLDRRVRDSPVPISLCVTGLNTRPDGPQPPPPTSRAHIMQSHTTFCIREASLIYLHRGYLARALAEHPEDPFKSRYHASVIAVHASSCAVLAGVRNAYALLPDLMPRVFFLWVHAFSAAIVLATIVIRAPSSALVQSSLKELDIACELFERAKEGCRPGRALPPLLKLRDRARRAYEDFRQGRGYSPVSDSPEEDTYGNDDIIMLGAKSRLVRVKPKSSSPVSGGMASPSAYIHDETGSHGSSESPQLNDYHPALAGYLKEYNSQLDRGAKQCSMSPVPGRVESLASAPGSNSGSSSSGVVALNAGPYDYSYQYAVPNQSRTNMMIPSALDYERQQPQPSYQFPSSHPSPQSQPQQIPPPPPQQQQQQFFHHRPQSTHDTLSNSQPPTATNTPGTLTPQYALGPSIRSPMPFFAQFSPHTPFSAFETSLAVPRRDGVPTPTVAAAAAATFNANPAGPGMGQIGQDGTEGFVSAMTVPSHFTGLDASLGKAPEAMDLGWQFMSDLRTYL